MVLQSAYEIPILQADRSVQEIFSGGTVDIGGKGVPQSDLAESDAGGKAAHRQIKVPEKELAHALHSVPVREPRRAALLRGVRSATGPGLPVLRLCE
jgi:hypothetical protein